MWHIVGQAWAAGGGVVPITQALTILVTSIQAAGGLFVALKCCWLGVTWRRGTEHGMDEFSAIGISAALMVGATAIGQAIGGAAGDVGGTPVLVLGLSELLGDVVGRVVYLSAALAPGLYLRRLLYRLRGGWRLLRRR